MQIEENVLFKDLTTVGIGGPARYLIRIQSSDELPQALEFAKEKNLPYQVIGGASNLLVADEGFNGVVIKMENTGIYQKEPGHLIVEAGTPLQELVDYSISHGLAGLHKMTGIPGTVGGAIYGNAGAYGQSISDQCVSISVFNPQTQTTQALLKKDCGFDYRESQFSKTNKHLVILEAFFELPSGDKDVLAKESKECLKLRQQKYKPGLMCPGSFFKNFLTSQIPQKVLDKLPPREDTYGKTPAYIFLEQLGAKGDRVGDIQITEFHANLIVNFGKGTAKDFWTLTKKWFDKVRKEYGIELEPEVQFINLPPLNS